MNASLGGQFDDDGDSPLGGDTISRILVALDTSTENFPALEAAAALGALLHAEVHGVFVEDPSLAHLEDNPSVHHMSLPTGSTAQVGEGKLQRAVRAQARRAKHRLARISEMHSVEWSFEIVQGQAEEKLTEAATEADLVIVESEGRPVMSRVRMPSTPRRAVREIGQSVLYLNRRVRQVRSVVTVFDGSKEAEKALKTAVQLHAGPDMLLTVLLAASDREQAEELEEMATSRLVPFGIQPHFRRLAPGKPEWVVDTVQSLHGDLLVVAEASPTLDEAAAEPLLEGLECPVLLVR